MALRLRAKGFEFKEIGEQIDVSKSSAHNAVIGLTMRTAKPLSWTPGPGRLMLEEREEISREIYIRWDPARGHAWHGSRVPGSAFLSSV
jgi:hypothetical protein